MAQDHPSISLLRALLHAESVTPDTSTCQALIAEQLKRLGFDVENLAFEGINNLWAYRRGLVDEALVFCGHTDVVPAGDLAAWEHPPFAAELVDGCIYGRGAVDMKGSIAAFVTALAAFLTSKKNKQLPYSLGLLITADEEGDAVYGTQRALQELRKRHVPIRYFLVGEPTCVQQLGDAIKNGRRGSLTMQLSLQGRQGHIAYQPAEENVLHKAIHLVDGLTQQYATRHAPGEGTSFQLIDLQGNAIAENVTPPQASLRANWRYADNLRADTIKRDTAKRIRDLKVPYELTWKHGAQPYTCAPGPLAQALLQAIAECCAGRPVFSVAGGVSDGRFCIAYDAAQPPEVMEFGPCGRGMHEVNEHIQVEELVQLSQVYRRVLELFRSGDAEQRGDDR